ncbi:MAG: HIT family protein [Deinococcota bacterium]
MDECVFCSIIKGHEPVSTIIDSNQVLALMSLHPFAEGHCLVIPKQHIASLHQLDEGLGQAIFTQAQRLARCVSQVVACDWVQLMMHDDTLIGSHTLNPFHLHMHVLPRQHSVPYTETRAAEASRQHLNDLAQQLGHVYTQNFGK